ncbi:hypothetical protein JOD15_002713 [Enterococcus ureilyticus]|nr:hypothetical protein [Enterococcus ureilyticus]
MKKEYEEVTEELFEQQLILQKKISVAEKDK